MTSLEFRQWVVRRLRRSDITTTSGALYDAIRIARSEIQKNLSLKGMEFQAKYVLPLAENDYRFALPSGFREEVSVRIHDADENLKIVLAKEPNREKFVRLVTIDTVSWITYEYRNSIIIMSNEGIEGFPLIFNIWNEVLESFPKVGGTAVGNYLWMDYYGYLLDDISGEVDSYEDTLLNEFKDLMFYRTMMELALDLKNAETVDRYNALYTTALIRANTLLVQKREAGYDGGCRGGEDR